MRKQLDGTTTTSATNNNEVLNDDAWPPRWPLVPQVVAVAAAKPKQHTDKTRNVASSSLLTISPHDDSAGWLLCLPNDDDDDDDENGRDDDDSIMTHHLQVELTTTRDTSNCSPQPPSLQGLCLTTLAKALPLYVEQCGVDVLHCQMSTMVPSWTRSALSVECSRLRTMTPTIAYVLGHHPDMDRLCIIPPMSPTPSSKCPYTDTDIDNGNHNYQSLSISSILCHHDSNRHNIRRLELGNIRLDKTLLEDISKLYCGRRPHLTHLSLRHVQAIDNESNNNDDDEDNNVSLEWWQQVMTVLPRNSLRVLDVSYNNWVTDEWLLNVLTKVVRIAPHLRHVHVTSCPNISKTILMQLNFTFRGRPVLSCQGNQNTMRSNRWGIRRPRVAWG